MLPLKTVEYVKQLLDEKCYSQRRIAELAGVSRGTVVAIATGKRNLHGRTTDSVSKPVRRVPFRCPGCGARVYLPCILCEARLFNERLKMFRSLTATSPKRVA